MTHALSCSPPQPSERTELVLTYPSGIGESPHTTSLRPGRLMITALRPSPLHAGLWYLPMMTPPSGTLRPAQITR
jgi:hypothetical protein